MQLELVLSDPNVISGLKTGPRERRDHADLSESLLEVAKRLFIAQIVPLKEQLNPATEDAKARSSSRRIW